MRSPPLLRILFVLLIAPSLAAAADANAPVDVAGLGKPIRVACLGDSITRGVGADAGWAYPDQLDRMLGADWDVRNFGHSGATVGRSDKHSIWNQKEYKDALTFHPDVVVIMLGTNDTKPDNWAEKAQFPKLYAELVESFQKLSSKPRVFVCTAPYVAKNGNFGINEPGVLEQMPMIRKVAEDLSAGVTDVHAATEKQDALFKDNVHPSTAGATLIAKAVYQSIAGRSHDGPIPDPAAATRKARPVIRVIESPGAITYRELYAFIAYAGMPPDKLAPAKAKFEAYEPELANKATELESAIGENDQQRMKFKHVDGKLYGFHKGEVARLAKELEKLRRTALLDLMVLVPAEHRAPVGAAWVSRYVSDRLAPLGGSVSAEQRKQIGTICAAVGEAYANINNTPERSLADIDAWRKVYDTVLTPEQKRRVEPR